MSEIDLSFESSIEHFTEHLCVNKRQAASTVTAYESRLRGFVRYLRGADGGSVRTWRQVDRRMAQSYVEYLESKDRSRGTINLTATSLRIFFDFLVLREEAEVNPFAVPFHDSQHTRKPPTDTHTLTEEDIRVLLGAPAGVGRKDAGEARSPFRRAREFSDYKVKRDEAMIGLIFFAGLKTGEVASLLEEHFDAKSSMLSVSNASMSRRVYLVPTAASAFAHSLDLKASLFPGSRHAFANKYGKRLTERSVHRLVAKYASECGVHADVCPADLRRAFERSLIMVQAEEWLIRYLLGFEQYSFSNELAEAMRSALEKLSERIELREHGEPASA